MGGNSSGPHNGDTDNKLNPWMQPMEKILRARRCSTVMAPPIVELKRRLFGSEEIPKDCLNLNQAVPSYPPPKVVLVTAKKVAESVSGAQYTGDAGLPELREAIARYHSERHAAQLTADEVLVTAGANLGFSMLALALTAPQVPVHVLTPYYFNHAMAVELCGGRLSEWRLAADTSLREALHAGRFRAREGEIVVVVNPSNPSGRCFPKEDIESVLAHTKQWGAFLIVDETYLEFFPPTMPPVSLMSLPGWQENAAVVSTFSKSLAITGYRVGYVCGSAKLLEQILKIQDAFIICAPHIGQQAALAGLCWDGLTEWLDTRRGEMESRVRVFAEAIAVSGCPFEVESAGAFFAYLRHPFDVDAWDVVSELARDAGILVLPGSCCGSTEWRYIRVAVGNADEETLALAADRMSKFCLSG
ncbi:MAG: aminotransferase class I/II-fold pyridoxal phosphate-dependent enzyme [Candidatus Zixiibacteriota bacterium]